MDAILRALNGAPAQLWSTRRAPTGNYDANWPPTALKLDEATWKSHVQGIKAHTNFHRVGKDTMGYDGFANAGMWFYWGTKPDMKWGRDKPAVDSWVDVGETLGMAQPAKMALTRGKAKSQLRHNVGCVLGEFDETHALKTRNQRRRRVQQIPTTPVKDTVRKQKQDAKRDPHEVTGETPRPRRPPGTKAAS